MKKFLSKLFLILLFTTYYLLHTTFPVHAQVSTVTDSNTSQPVQAVQNVNPYIVPNTTSDVKPGLHSWVPAVLNEMMAATVCFLGGIDPITKTHNCLGITSSGKLGYVPQQGINRMMASSLNTIYQTGFPVSSATYIHYLANNFGLVKNTAYAAGMPDQSTISGFQGLSPLISIWSVIRNLAYLLIIIAFIVIGLAIMLRVKIDPRTVMTIENQLPKLVVGLLFVTFSFAIAGLMVDGMKILDGLIFNIYQSIPDDTTQKPPIHFNKSINWTDNIQNSDPWNAVEIIVPSSDKSAKISIDFPTLSILPDYIGPIQIPDSLNKIKFPPWEVNVPLGESGARGLATDAAVVFSGVLKTFFNIQPTNISAAQLVPIVGAISIPLQSFGSAFGKGSPVGFIFDMISFFIATSIGNWIGGLVSQASAVQSVLGNNAGVLGFILGMGITTFSVPPVFDFFDIVIKNLGLPIIIWFIVYIAIFLAMARLFFNLVFAWATILFQVAIGPLLIVFGLIPGLKGGGFTGWLKTLAANLMAFPITIGILLLGSALVQATSNVTTFFIPPLIGAGQIQIGLLMALSTIFAASNGPQIAKDLFEEKDNKNFGAFGQSSGTSLQAVSGAGKAAIYGFGKTPTPGSSGGALTALGQIWR